MSLGKPALIAGVLVGAALAGPALADCRPPAQPVARVQGVVREAAGGAALCIQTGPDHQHLTRVRLSDVAAPALTAPGGEGAKWALRRLARGRRVDCRMDVGTADAGVCAIDGERVGVLLAAKGR
jgi:hypothetical protein